MGASARNLSVAWCAACLGAGLFSAGCAAPGPLPATRPALARSAGAVERDVRRTPPPGRPNIFGEMYVQDQKPAPSAGAAGMQQHTACDEGYDADVAADPTGKWLAFTSTRHSERSRIYLQRVDGASVMQLTADHGDDAHPAFSPDGKRIAFCSNRAGNWDIYVMDIDGRNVEQITRDPAQEMHPSFSPDGSRLVFCALSPRAEQWELWVVNLSTHERKLIGPGLFPVWSPRKDVDRIAFQRPRQRGSRWFSVWTLDLVDGEPRRVTEVAASSNAAVVSPSWSPDGSRLAVATIIEPAANTPGAGGRCDIWTLNADGGGRQRLTDGSAVYLSPCWSSDNRVYFISDRGGHENVWSVRVDAKGSLPGQQPAAVGKAD